MIAGEPAEETPVVRATGGDASGASVILAFPAGLIRYDDKGRKRAHAVSIRIEQRLVTAEEWQLVTQLDITAAKTEAFYRQHSWEFPSGPTPNGYGETPMEALATNMALAARAIGTRIRSLSIVVGRGGTPYAELKKGTQLYANAMLAIARAKVLAEANGWRIAVPAWFTAHGEGDQSNASYGANLTEWQADVDADVKTITGQQAPVHFIMSQPSSHPGVGASARAMLDLHISSPVHHLAGPDYPFMDQFSDDYLPLGVWPGLRRASCARWICPWSWTACVGGSAMANGTPDAAETTGFGSGDRYKGTGFEKPLSE